MVCRAAGGWRPCRCENSKSFRVEHHKGVESHFPLHKHPGEFGHLISSNQSYPCIYSVFMGQAESKLHLSPKYFLLPRFPLLPGQLLTLVPKALVMIYGILIFRQATFFSCLMTHSSQPFLR